MALTTVPASLSATALTLTTAAQPNITSVGTLTGLTVSGNIAGTLTTAAQTNITSVGTLTGLTVSATNVLFDSNSYNILEVRTDANNDGSSDDGIIKITNSSSSTTKAEFRWDESEDTVQLAYGDHGRHIVIDSSGNVGIGYATPSSFNASGNNLVIGGGASGDNTGLTIYSNSDSSGSIHFADSTSGTDAYVGDIYYNHASNFMAFLTSATERLRIDSSGNVGIGASNPSQKLHVVGKIKSTDDLIIGGANPRIDYDGGSSGALRFFSVSANLERMRITSAGQVGIGETSPSSYYSKNLVVMTDGDGTGGLTLVSPATDDNAYLCFADGTSGAATYAGYLGYDHNNDKAFIGVGGATQLTILSDGKTAIGGNHTPAHALHVKGAVSTTGGVIAAFDATDSTNTWMQLKNSNSGNSWQIGSTDAGIRFYNDETSGYSGLTIAANGHISISDGTTAPTAQLTITDENAGQAVIHARNFATSATGSFGNAHAFEFRAATSTTTHGMLVALNENNASRRSLEIADSTGIFATFVNGRLGIGRNNPSARLHLQSTGSTTYSGSSAGSNIGLYLTNAESGAAGRTIGIGLTCESNAEVYLNAVTAANNNGGDFVIASRDAGTRAEKMRVHAAGSVTMPKQTYVQGRGNAGWSATAGSATWNLQPHNSTPVLSSNRGNSYSASNKRFTCPVDGVYLVQASWYIYQTYVATVGGQYVHPAVAKNGSLSWNGGHQPYTISGQMMNQSGSGSKHYDGVQISFTIACSAGDYLEIKLYSPNSNPQSYEHYHYFSYALLY